MWNTNIEAKKLLKDFIKMSNSNWWGLVHECDFNMFIEFVKFCFDNKVSFPEEDFLFIFKNESDWLWIKYTNWEIKKLYWKYIEYREVLKTLEELI